ncbi:hypothetical protein [Paenibacillus sp. An7]|uniref:hypothetical protein n=1 Tax=Paenibacillus sp. An7 TaxID=2689577 RepID=UPI001F18D9DE|nr:hypothetical protein [Paenibacillus sp. An7]
MLTAQSKNYLSFIRSLPIKEQYSKQDLLIEDLLLAREGQLEMYYAPHNEYINPLAKIVIVGITPGWTQMERAYQAAAKSLHRGETEEEACKAAKIAARFAGSMRTNIISMLEALDLPHYFGIEKTSDLFDAKSNLLHTTSLLKYPVFVDKQNYNGHVPSLLKSEFLYEKVLGSFPQEISMLGNPLIIPLGKSVETVLHRLIQQNQIKTENFLWGFPHPSGANGHRHKQFEKAKPEMIRRLRYFQMK